MTIARPLYGPSSEEPFQLRAVPDLAGTEVVDAEGRYLGTVYGSLADAVSGLIRYLDLDLSETDRHILLPLGHTRLVQSPERTEIELRAATRRDLMQIPTYASDREMVDSTYQRRLLAAHGRIYRGERYYAHPAYDHSGLYAGEHVIVEGRTGDSIGTPGDVPLRSLSEMANFQVAAGDTDIRGWPLVDAGDRHAGTVEDLLFDPAAEKVRYLLARTGSRDELTPIPVGLADLEEEPRQIRTPTLRESDLSLIPQYQPGSFGRAEEEEVLRAIEDRLDGERYYDRPDFRAG